MLERKLSGRTHRADERIEETAVFDLAGELRGKRVLDLGCGDGTYSITASQKGAQVTGLDVSETMLEAARHRATAAGASVEWCPASAEAIPMQLAADAIDVL